jgi:hypothetical protein
VRQPELIKQQKEGDSTDETGLVQPLGFLSFLL